MRVFWIHFDVILERIIIILRLFFLKIIAIGIIALWLKPVRLYASVIVPKKSNVESSSLPLESMGFSVLCCLEPHRKKVFFAIGFYSMFKVCGFVGKISLKPSV